MGASALKRREFGEKGEKDREHEVFRRNWVVVGGKKHR